MRPLRNRTPPMLFVLCGVLMLSFSCASSRGDTKDELGLQLKKEAIEDKNAISDIQYRKEKNAAPNYLVLARTLTEKGFYDVALGQLKEAEKSIGENAEIFYLKGVCFREKWETEKAVSQFEKAVSMNPDYAYAYAGLAVTRDVMGEHQKALACYHTAIRIDPGVSSFYNNLGVSLMADGKVEEAVEKFEKSIALNPNGRRAINNLGLCCGMLGEDDRAFSLFQKAGSRADACNNMGYVSQMTGKRKRAAEMYRRALEIDPSSVAAKRNLKTLEEASKTLSSGASEKEMIAMPPEAPRNLQLKEIDRGRSGSFGMRE